MELKHTIVPPATQASRNILFLSFLLVTFPETGAASGREFSYHPQTDGQHRLSDRALRMRPWLFRLVAVSIYAHPIPSPPPHRPPSLRLSSPPPLPPEPSIPDACLSPLSLPTPFVKPPTPPQSPLILPIPLPSNWYHT